MCAYMPYIVYIVYIGAKLSTWTKDLAVLAVLSSSLGWTLALLVLQNKNKGREAKDVAITLALLTQALLIAGMCDTLQKGEILTTLTIASTTTLSFVILAFRGLKPESPEVNETSYVVATSIFKMEVAYYMGIPRGAAIFCIIYGMM